MAVGDDPEAEAAALIAAAEGLRTKSKGVQSG